MRYEHEKVGDIIVVRIQEKKLTSHEAPEMKTTLLGLIIGEGEQFILNLKDVEYMDSTGLGAFLFGIRQAENYEKDLVSYYPFDDGEYYFQPGLQVLEKNYLA